MAARNPLKALGEKLAWASPAFLVTVAVPTLAATLYFGLVASDVYTSESSFVVRAPERQSVSTLGAVLRGAGFNTTHNDGQTVAEYILSRDALRVLDQQIGLGRAYASPQVDRFSRFAGLGPDNSFEALHKYYGKMVTVQQDAVSSITTLSVRAFTAGDSADANRILLEQAEALVNRLNERGRQDMIRFAQSEVTAAAGTAQAASLALSRYRDTQGVVDPERQAAMQLQQVAKLQEELIATTTQLAQLRQLTPQNPQIPALKSRASTLRAEIRSENTKVTGGSRSLANKAAGYQRLALEAEFANRQLASAMASLETARSEAQRKQVYLERIAQPSLPDVAQDPRRLRGILSTLVLGLVAWGILSMLLAGLREHEN